MGFTEQFGHPRGLVGSLVGHLMALKNTARSRWVVELLAPRPGERVLEIGFGSGTDVRRVLQRVGASGSVAGVDVSEAMLRQASGRNRGAIAGGRVLLKRGGAGALPFDDASFDAAFSINSAQFWPDLAGGFRELWRVVREGGRVLVAVQPMQRGATSADSKRWVDALMKAARETGWVDADQHLECISRRAGWENAPALTGEAGAFSASSGGLFEALPSTFGHLIGMRWRPGATAPPVAAVLAHKRSS